MQRFRGSVLGMLIMLIAQFLLGMALNLFVSITRHHPGANGSNFFGGGVQSVFWGLTQGPVVLILHVILGILLFLNAIAIIVSAFRRSRTGNRVAAVLGFVGVLIAGFNGASFLNYNQDVNSYFMSIGFAAAVIFYTQILFATPADASAG